MQYSGEFHGKLCFLEQCEKISMQYIQPVKGNYRKVSCLGEHNTQGTLASWVNKQGNYRICR